MMMMMMMVTKQRWRQSNGSIKVSTLSMTSKLLWSAGPLVHSLPAPSSYSLSTSVNLHYIAWYSCSCFSIKTWIFHFFGPLHFSFLVCYIFFFGILECAAHFRVGICATNSILKSEHCTIQVHFLSFLSHALDLYFTYVLGSILVISRFQIIPVDWGYYLSGYLP